MYRLIVFKDGDDNEHYDIIECNNKATALRIMEMMLEGEMLITRIEIELILGRLVSIPMG